MGRETKTFRQTNKAGRADSANRNYARINRAGSWGKMSNLITKGGNYSSTKRTK